MRGERQRPPLEEAAGGSGEQQGSDRARRQTDRQTDAGQWAALPALVAGSEWRAPAARPSSSHPLAPPNMLTRRSHSTSSSQRK